MISKQVGMYNYVFFSKKKIICFQRNYVLLKLVSISTSLLFYALTLPVSYDTAMAHIGPLEKDC